MRLDELDPGCLAAEAVHQVVAAAAERGHHAADLGVHPLVGEGGGGRPLRRVVGAGGGVRLKRRHGLGEVGRRQRGADPPPGHRVRLARAVDDRPCARAARRAGPAARAPDRDRS